MLDLQRKIRIAVDVTFLQDQYANRGIGRYGKEIVQRLILLSQSNAPLIPELHLLGFGNLVENLTLLDIDPNTVTANVHFHTLGAAQASTPVFNFRLYFGRIRPLIKKLHPDFYFAVHFDRGLPSRLVPTLVTIHDAIPLATGQYSSRGPVLNLLKGIFYKYMWQGVRMAKQVFTSSNFSRADLIKYGKVASQRIQVIYLGIADYFAKQNITQDQKVIDGVLGNLDLLDAKSDPIPYMLYDSGLESNKNIPALLRIFSKLAEREPELKLVLIGGDFQRTGSGYLPINDRSQEAVQLAKELGIADRLVPTGRISEEDLVVLLAHAREYINLSGYEGFGFGPLQAMAAGVPVIISNRGSFPEIAGIAAIVVDPDTPEKAAAHIIESLSNVTAVQEMVQAGFMQAARYKWENTLTQTWDTIVRLWTNPTQN